MAIQITIGPDSNIEKQYVIHTVFKDYLSIEQIEIRIEEDFKGYLIKFEGKNLKLPDVFFHEFYTKFLKKGYTNKFPIPEKIDLNSYQNISKKITESGDLISIFKKVEADKGFYDLEIDIFGTCFFLLSMFDEFVNHQEEEYQWFPLNNSYLFIHQLCERPIVDEYASLLKYMLLANAKLGEFKLNITHDIDIPFFDSSIRFPRKMKSIVGDFVLRKSPELGFKRISKLFNRNTEKDLYWTFPYILKLARKYELNNQFYFKSGASHPTLDFSYDYTKFEFKDLFYNLLTLGHEIGIHPSYQTPDDFSLFKKEATAFNNFFLQNFGYKIRGGRHHFLRWDYKTSFKNWAEIGYEFDSTMGFPKMTGFRTSTCRPHSVFDLKTRTPLELREVPLVMMDTTIDYFLKLSLKEKKEKMLKLYKSIKYYGGVFTVLYHNQVLITRKQKLEYEFLLENCR
jgi:hypothetical protein